MIDETTNSLKRIASRNPTQKWTDLLCLSGSLKKPGE